MALRTRAEFLTEILNNIADSTTKINDNITTNGNGEITGAKLNSVMQDLKSALEDLSTDLKDSVFFLNTDSTDDITEGADPDKRFFTDAYFQATLSNAAIVTTDDLNEGVTNLYYTDVRADARVDALRPTQGAITAPAGGATVDAEARTAINAIISALQSSNITL